MSEISFTVCRWTVNKLPWGFEPINPSWGIAQAHPVGDLVRIGRGMLTSSDATNQSRFRKQDPCNAALKGAFVAAAFDLFTYGAGTALASAVKRSAALRGLANESRVFLSTRGRINAVGAATRELTFLNDQARAIALAAGAKSGFTLVGATPFLGSGAFWDAVGAVPLPGFSTLGAAGNAAVACQ